MEKHQLWNQYSVDAYKNTKQILSAIRSDHTERLQSKLPSQGFLLSFLLDNSLKQPNSLRSKTQSKVPTNIFNFTIKYLNNTLSTRKNLYLWNLSPTSDYSSCSQPESLLHVVAGCKTYLDQGRFTWRHNSALNFLAQTFQAIGSSKLYVDLPAYLSPCIVTGDSLRPDLLLISPNNCLYILELTVGFETHLDINSHRRKEKYRPLLKDLNCNYRQVQLVDLSMSCLGIFGHSSDSFLEMCKCIGIDQSHLNYILSKISSIIIRTTYYIFCSRNKPWSNPELLSY